LLEPTSAPAKYKRPCGDFAIGPFVLVTEEFSTIIARQERALRLATWMTAPEHPCPEP
jgi:hypothetical protein